jgi:cation transporter-like permease
MALASAVYYGALTWLVTRLGTDFETVVQNVMHANKVLTIVAGAIVLIIVVWIVRRRLQRPPPPPPS